jgi:hypothetical protein
MRRVVLLPEPPTFPPHGAVVCSGYLLSDQYTLIMVRKVFEGYDEPINIDMDPEEALAIVLQVVPCADESSESSEDGPSI